jgi:predicted CXXCH cytochrome family protein
MRPYDLPVDQYALYQTSGHGMRLKTGDRRVAVCSDCHGAHEVLPPSDPASRVYTTNIPRTCGTCHGDSVLVRERKIPNVYQEFLSSVHARQLFDKGNLRSATCVSCHGVHGAAPPEVGDVNKVCGRCHSAERRYFLAGPHKQGMDDERLAECSSCHGDHAIHETQPERFASGCLDCHDASSPQAAVGKGLLSDYRQATAEITKADALIARADAVPLQTDDYRARIEEARTYLREAMTAMHAVRPDVMSSFTLRASSVGSEIQSEIRGKLGNIRTSKLLLILFWFYVIVTASILRRIRNRAPGEK